MTQLNWVSDTCPLSVAMSLVFKAVYNIEHRLATILCMDMILHISVVSYLFTFFRFIAYFAVFNILLIFKPTDQEIVSDLLYIMSS